MTADVGAAPGWTLEVTRDNGHTDRYPTAIDHVVTDGHLTVLRAGEVTRLASYPPGRWTRARWLDDGTRP